MNYRYIAIEGNIGAGKTSLAAKLAQAIGAELILEEFLENEFLPKFYTSAERYAFPLEVSFLVDRFTQLRSILIRSSTELYIADYFFDKCLVFGRNNLSGAYLDLFLKLFQNFASQLPSPDILIYVHRDIPQLQLQIKKRGRDFESRIADKYLELIEESYRSYLNQITRFPVLYVYLKELDYLTEELIFKDMEKLLGENWPKGITRLNF